MAAESVYYVVCLVFFFFQAEDGIRDLVRSRGLGDVYKRQYKGFELTKKGDKVALNLIRKHRLWEVFLVKYLHFPWDKVHDCLLYTSDAADDLLCVDLGGRRIIKKKKTKQRKYYEDHTKQKLIERTQKNNHNH